MIWMISKLYDGQFGEVTGSTGRSRKFNITGGVRQGCVLSPRLFCAVLQFAMRKWRMKVGDLGFDLSDGMPHLIDLRFADDILLFARSAMEVRKLLDSLVAELSEVGLLLNADKTVILTSQSQPPSTITIDHGVTLRVLPGNVAQKWLGCMFSCTRIGTKIFGPAISAPTSGKSVSCQQMDFGRPDGSHFAAPSVL